MLGHVIGRLSDEWLRSMTSHGSAGIEGRCPREDPWLAALYGAVLGSSPKRRRLHGRAPCRAPVGVFQSLVTPVPHQTREWAKRCLGGGERRATEQPRDHQVLFASGWLRNAVPGHTARGASHPSLRRLEDLHTGSPFQNCSPCNSCTPSKWVCRFSVRQTSHPADHRSYPRTTTFVEGAKDVSDQRRSRWSSVSGSRSSHAMRSDVLPQLARVATDLPLHRSPCTVLRANIGQPPL